MPEAQNLNPIVPERMARRLRFEAEHPGASGACPSFFRAAVHECRMGGEGYVNAGRQLARSVLQLVVGEVDKSALDEWIATDTGEAAVEWLNRYLPRCMALIPKRRLGRFTKGVQEVINEDIIDED